MIKNQGYPRNNCVMSFWKFNQEKNPNCNIFNDINMKNNYHNKKNNEIDDDIKQLMMNENKKYKKEKYRKVSIDEAFELQHRSLKWITTYHGELNVNQRFIYKQKYSSFTEKFRNCLYKHQSQLNISNEQQLIKQNHNKETKLKKNKKIKRLSSPIFKYDDNKWIKVEAINDELEEELTQNDRKKLYEFSIGKCKENKKVSIMEINDICHPAKRDNLDQPVFGIFATEHISKTEIIFEYVGCVMSFNEYENEVSCYQRFDGQYRSHKLESYSDNQFNNGFVINSSYFSNECVFVNDATHDNLFGKWSFHNVSFFEIVINDWPHIFLRAFVDIKPGEELLTEYGNGFWKRFQDDMTTSYNLNQYYQHRIYREKEVNQLLNNKQSENDQIKLLQNALRFQIEKNEKLQGLLENNTKQINNKQIVQKVKNQMSEITEKAKELYETNKEQKMKIELLEEKNCVLTQQLHEQIAKKKKYKDKLRCIINDNQITSSTFIC